MEENQTSQNLNQQPAEPQAEQVQPVVQEQTVPETVQQPTEPQPSQVEQPQQTEQASVSMQIQQLLVQQQQYQKQYNELVDYAKKTPGLTIDQVNQIKGQLDQLNALFVQGKQKLQELGYNQVQVNKPTEVKKGAKNNFSFKKLAIGCGIVVLLILAGFFVTLSSLIKNPTALQGIGVDAAMAKTLLQAFTGLLFGSIIILMLGVVVSNIYRLITVKNQSKGKYVLGLIGGLIGAGAVGAGMGAVFGMIGKIVTEVVRVDYDIIQPYLVGRVENEGEDEFSHPYRNESISGIGSKYSLIAPSEIAFSLRYDEFTKLKNKRLPSESEIVAITLSCGNENKDIELGHSVDKYGRYKFEGTCLYSQKGKYTYSINVTYNNSLTKERKTETFSINSLDFTSEVSLYKTTTTSSSSNNKTSRLDSDNGEFILGKAPAKITVDSTQVFRDFSLGSYETQWDLDGDFVNDRENQTTFDYSYKKPQVYYVSYKFSGLSDDIWYRFPVRVEQSDRPVCEVNVTRFPGTTKYQISTDFVDSSSVATISSYNYTIQNTASKKALEELKDYPQEFNYTFPEKGRYVVVLDYVTVDGKQGQCESDAIELEKETFNVQYSVSEKDLNSSKFVEICSSAKSGHSNCTQVSSTTVPQTYHLYIESIKPYSNTMKKVVYFDDTPLLNEDNTYSFDVYSEGTYNLKIVLSDKEKGMDEEVKEIVLTVKKPDIVGHVTITSRETKLPVVEGFEPLTVVLDASATEINIPGDEIIYFTWDFGDGEVKTNQQNGVAVHTYNYNYAKENGIFEPKVTVTTLQGKTETIIGPKLNVKKGLVTMEISSPSHISRQSKAGEQVTFTAEFDGLPEKMTWDFGDGSPAFTCPHRTCTDVMHTYSDEGMYTVRLTLDLDKLMSVDGSMNFKVYK